MSECGKLADLFGAYVYGDLPPDEMRKVRVHADGCDSCRHEIETRTKAVALVPNDLPRLTDDERLRVTWAVKGALRAQNEGNRFRVFSVAALKGFAVTTVVVAAFAAGAIYGFRGKPKVIVKAVPAQANPAPKTAPAEDTVVNNEHPKAPPTLFALDPYRRPYGVETSRKGVERPANPESENGPDSADPNAAQSPIESIMENQSAPQAQENVGLDPIWPELPPAAEGETEQ